jgi:hypothetical protein
MRAPFVTVYSLTPPPPLPRSEYDLNGPAEIGAFLGITAERAADLLNRGAIPARRFSGQWAARSRHLHGLGLSAEARRNGGAA